ncbi:cysteine desulfurase family protein [Nesterenkonia sp. PF2B19]|uniref:cysteine desulfurase family protein n=1 Tax=Nesterenkonia sp. PF2B19 TaxID=1881858 RepID=UPI000A19C986|nr:cysteine desulfurase family protein [Nesterenkonia sp. PF2B19]OSM44181.1 cysteine desulfurase [Nesterenkonia sp. PF2B19]
MTQTPEPQEQPTLSGPSTVYLDAAASAPVRREVLEAMWPLLAGVHANPSSRHEPGLAAERALTDARARVARSLGARPGEILFTSGGTEADNAAVKGIALAAPRGRHVLISAVEHPAVAESASWLERIGYEVDVLPVDDAGVVDPDELQRRLRSDTTLVSVQTASNEVGTVQDIASLAAVAAETGTPFHTDAVQAAGSETIDVRELGVQALSLAGHKLGTPKGVGVLWLRRRTPFEPLIHGGGQQRGDASGTEDVAGAVGMATALELAAAEDTETLRRRRDDFIAAVEEGVPGARLTGHRTRRLAGHASFVLPGRSGESVLLDLERAGIFCSSGSACAAGSSEASPSLTAMGVPEDLAQTAVRFTFDVNTSSADLARAAEALIRSACAAP